MSETGDRLIFNTIYALHGSESVCFFDLVAVQKVSRKSTIASSCTSFVFVIVVHTFCSLLLSSSVAVPASSIVATSERKKHMLTPSNRFGITSFGFVNGVACAHHIIIIISKAVGWCIVAAKRAQTFHSGFCEHSKL